MASSGKVQVRNGGQKRLRDEEGRGGKEERVSFVDRLLLGDCMGTATGVARVMAQLACN